MHKPIPHASNITPVYLSMSPLEIGRYFLACFSDNLEISDDSILSFSIFKKSLITHTSYIALRSIDSLLDISNIFRVVSLIHR